MNTRYYCFSCEIELESSECEEDDEGYLYCQYCGEEVNPVREADDPDPYGPDTLEEEWL